jgi:hypothetical protein
MILGRVLTVHAISLLGETPLAAQRPRLRRKTGWRIVSGYNVGMQLESHVLQRVMHP